MWTHLIKIKMKYLLFLLILFPFSFLSNNSDSILIKRINYHLNIGFGSNLISNSSFNYKTYTPNEQEDDPDVYYIGRGESHLNVADWIYEFINLSIPMQRKCGEDENGQSKCNPEVIEKLKKMEEEAKVSQSNVVWKGLDQFKNLQ